MPQVLLFAEHELTDHERTSVLTALAELPYDDVEVRVLVPLRQHSTSTLSDEIAMARGGSATAAVADVRHDATAARAQARRHLDHVIAGVRAGGYPAEGEVVPVHDEVKDLLAEAMGTRATAALVVTSQHRVAHLLRRDLEQRLRHAGIENVVHVDGVVPHQVRPDER